MSKRREWANAWAKVRDEQCCRVCGSTQIVDPAHIIARSRVTQGGEDPRNIVPLCRLCHMRADQGTGIDLLPYLTRDEQAYAVELVGLAEAYQRLTGTRLAA